MTIQTSSNAASSSPEGSGRGESSEASDPQSWLARARSLLRRRRGPSLRASLSDTLADPETAEDAFSPEERAMLRNILDLRERSVYEAMTPRADVIAVSEDISLIDLLAVFREAGHSRLPVYRGSLDDPVGMAHIKDLMGALIPEACLDRPAERSEDGPRRSLAALRRLATVDLGRSLAAAGIVRPVLFATPATPILDLVAEMRATRTHMALVIDEYGGTDGLVTIEDLIEEVFGDISDEHDPDEQPMIVRGPNGRLIADARAPLEDVSAMLGFDVTHGEDIGEIETLGGLIVTLAGRVPIEGESIPGPKNIWFEILDADSRRIKTVALRRAAADLAESDAVSSRSLGIVEGSHYSLLASEAQER